MKKSLLKSVLLSSFLISALLVTGCKPKDENAVAEKESSKKTEVVKEPVSLQEMPSSGAKTYITTQVGASNFVKNLGTNVDEEKLIEEATSVIDIEKITEQLGELYEDSSYAESIENLVEKIKETVAQAVENAISTGSVDLNIEEHPGAASDFPAGYSLDIPQVVVKVKGSVNDINNPSSGSAEAEINTSVKATVENITAAIPELNVNAKLNVSTDPIKQALKADGTVGEKFAFMYEMEGASLKINALNNDVTIRGDYDGSKGSANVKLNNNFSTELEIDAAKLGIPSSPVKYIKSVTTVNGNLDGNPVMNSDKSFRGNVNYDYQISSKTGMSFASSDGIGGKVISDVKLNFKGAVNIAEAMQIMSILTDLSSDLFGGMKLTEEEFKDQKIPFDAFISVKFFDDNNKETLDFLNIKSTYDLYSFIYDYVSGMNEDDFDDLIENFADWFYDLKYMF